MSQRPVLVFYLQGCSANFSHPRFEVCKISPNALRLDMLCNLREATRLVFECSKGLRNACRPVFFAEERNGLVGQKMS